MIIHLTSFVKSFILIMTFLLDSVKFCGTY